MAPSRVRSAVVAALLVALAPVAISARGAALSLRNGRATTPPMGWLAWERFRCNIDCDADPRNCIREELFQQMAERLMRDGYRAAGYEYVGIDDCWMAGTRDGDGRMLADPERFPSGIKALADFAHARGLKLGLYSDIGLKTCERYPGMAGHMEIDAETFASWEIDYLKVDGCFANFDMYGVLYPELGRLLNQTGRQIVYSCSWPAYYHYMSRDRQRLISNYDVPYEAMRDAGCNLWRNWRDIDTSWDAIKAIIKYWFKASLRSPGFTDIAGPGAWNDPDMLIIGNKGITVQNARAQMGMWAIFAAPLLMSNDLRRIDAASKDVLLNREVIAVNQDPAGKQGEPVACLDDNCSDFQVWKRPLADGSIAVALLNLSDEGKHMCVDWKHLGLEDGERLRARDLFAKRDAGSHSDRLCADVEAQSVALFRMQR